jgi:hypothetical protein
MIILSPKGFGDGQNSAYRHQNMKGAFGNEGALPFSTDFLTQIPSQISFPVLIS